MNYLYQERLSRVRVSLERKRLGGLLVTHPPNVRYLCGFTGSAGALLVTGERALFVTDGRYRIQAKEEVVEAKVRIARGDPAVDAVTGLDGRSPVAVGFEASRMTFAALRRLKRATSKRVRWRPLDGLVEGLRATKDPAEVQALRAACRLGSLLFDDVLPAIKEGVSELDLAGELDFRMKRAGASGPAFETIVAFGERSALPHARPTDRRLRKNELVLLDWGVILRGYCCDLTRTVYLGRAPAQVRGWYQAVREAQAAAVSRARAGVAAGQVDGAARRVLRQAGLARYFVHSTGHGLGLEVHEGPRLARGQGETLQAGNVVTIEPGIYVEGIGGIRIEDDVLIGSGEAEVLTTASRDFIQL